VGSELLDFYSDLPIYRDGILITDPIALFSEPHKLTEESSDFYRQWIKYQSMLC
jgi:hypothetical protein